MSSASARTGEDTPFSSATAAATRPSSFSHSAGCACFVPCNAMAQAAAFELPMAYTFAPRLAAWRIRCANRGWSLRKWLPTTNARSITDKEAMLRPSQRAPAGTLCSAWRSLKSMLSEPSPRTSAFARYSSSTVLCGLASNPIELAPC